jgi:hypothetical protein
MRAEMKLDRRGGGETGIRTPDRLLTYTRFPGVRLKPLIHLSGGDAHYSKLLGARPYPERPIVERPMSGL